jgi:hypothetical protein
MKATRPTGDFFKKKLVAIQRAEQNNNHSIDVIQPGSFIRGKIRTNYWFDTVAFLIQWCN